MEAALGAMRRALLTGAFVLCAAAERQAPARRRRARRLRIVHKGSALHVDLRVRGKRAGRLRRDSVPKGTVKFAVRLTHRPAR
jgi:hypothetical protein